MLAIRVIAVGEKMPAWVRRGWDEYARRIRGRCALTLVEVAAAYRGKNADPGKIARLEASRLQRAIQPGSRVIALDRGGQTWSTPELSGRMQAWMRHGGRVALLVGGPDGLPPQLLREADDTWSLSALTFAHPIVRVIVAEQLYRGYSLLEGLPYHR